MCCCWLCAEKPRSGKQYRPISPPEVTKSRLAHTQEEMPFCNLTYVRYFGEEEKRTAELG